MLICKTKNHPPLPEWMVPSVLLLTGFLAIAAFLSMPVDYGTACSPSLGFGPHPRPRRRDAIAGVWGQGNGVWLQQRVLRHQGPAGGPVKSITIPWLLLVHRLSPT